MTRLLFTFLILFSNLPSCVAQQPNTLPQPLGIALENYDYPFAVHYLPLNIEGQDVRMAYMDVKPLARANGNTVVLMHGKNFFGAYWEKTIAYLRAQGYRVVVPDQLGFGKSSKPAFYYSFHRLAENTRLLLDALGVHKTVVIGHSMGGMLATRFALMYPERTSHLVLENPIGLEDYKTIVPYATVEKDYQKELKKTEEGIRKYHQTYYVEWQPEYERYVQVHYRWTLGGEYHRLALANALTSQMVYTQPVVYEYALIKVPTLLIIGQADRTAIGKDLLTGPARAKVGNYPVLGKHVAKTIPGAKLVELENVGHIPHFEAVDNFHKEVVAFISRQN